MNKNWLTLYPDVFLWCKGERGIIYNAANNRSFIFENTNTVKRYTERLTRPEQLYCIELDANDFNNTDLKRWIEQLQSTRSAQIVSQEARKPKPVSLIPMLNLQKRVERLQSDQYRSSGEDILTYLQEVTLYLGGELYPSIDYYRQFRYPVNSEETLPVKRIASFLKQTTGSYLQTLHIAGGDLLKYPELSPLLERLKTYPLQLCFYMTASEFLSDQEKKSDILSGTNRKLFLLCRAEECTPELRDKLSASHLSTGLNFIVSSKSEFEKVNSFSQSCKGNEIEVCPLYTGANLDFFQKNVFVSTDDVNMPGLCRREVFAHQVLNTNFFGHLTVMPDGRVYGNVNRPALGNMDESLYTLLCREMDQKNSWRYVRDMNPCKHCIYQWLCPSPSNYELVIEKPDLCTIKRV